MKLLPNFLRYRVHSALALCVLLPAASVSTLPTAAYAYDLTVVVQVAEYAKKAYDVYKQGKSLLGDQGPSLSTQLENVKKEILGEIRYQRNKEFRDGAESVFTNFAILGNRERTDSRNEGLRARMAELSISLINNYASAVEDLATGTTDDVESAYQLAPTFNLLLINYIGLTKMASEINPNIRVPWGEYNILLQKGMRTNARLVGTRSEGCFESNPGRGNYTEEGAGTLNTRLRAFTNSQFWTKKVANLYVAVDHRNVPDADKEDILGVIRACYGGAAPNAIPLVETACHVGKHECRTTCRYIGQTSGSFPARVTKNPPYLRLAEDEVKPEFDADPVVKTIRAGMRGLLSVGGGNANADGKNLTLPTKGKLVDPSIGSCSITIVPGFNPITVPGKRYPITP